MMKKARSVIQRTGLPDVNKAIQDLNYRVGNITRARTRAGICWGQYSRTQEESGLPGKEKEAFHGRTCDPKTRL